MRVRRRSETLALAGLFTLLLTNDVGGSTLDKIYLLQGEPGAKGETGDGLSCDDTTCTVSGNKNLVVNGDGKVNGEIVAGTGVFAELQTDELWVSVSIWEPECPSGYIKDTSENDYILCKKSIENDKFDEMVKVGSFWIDRYEMSAWSDANCSGGQFGVDDVQWPMLSNGSGTGIAYACSVPGVPPSAEMTWFQAQRACAASGKRLCADAEWQTAALGTPDPPTGDDTDPGDGFEVCNIWSNSKPQNARYANSADRAAIMTGTADQCISLFGAYDMIGNVWEWVADWRAAGMHYHENSSDNGERYPWPAGEYNNDGIWNVNGSARNSTDTTDKVEGMLAAPVRGGDWKRGSAAGVYSESLLNGPSRYGRVYGARCCR